MIAEVNIFGVFISTALFTAGIAGLLHVLFRRLLQQVGFYRFVAHQNLLDISLFVILWGVIALTMSTFADFFHSILG
ncbi:MAG: DUF1656 domain-containing protein [Legionellales bacterium]